MDELSWEWPQAVPLYTSPGDMYSGKGPLMPLLSSLSKVHVVANWPGGRAAVKIPLSDRPVDAIVSTAQSLCRADVSYPRHKVRVCAPVAHSAIISENHHLRERVLLERAIVSAFHKLREELRWEAPGALDETLCLNFPPPRRRPPRNLVWDPLNGS